MLGLQWARVAPLLFNVQRFLYNFADKNFSYAAHGNNHRGWDRLAAHSLYDFFHARLGKSRSSKYLVAVQLLLEKKRIKYEANVSLFVSKRRNTSEKLAISTCIRLFSSSICSSFFRLACSLVELSFIDCFLLRETNATAVDCLLVDGLAELVDAAVVSSASFDSKLAPAFRNKSLSSFFELCSLDFSRSSC